MGGRVSVNTTRLRRLKSAMKGDIPSEALEALAERTRENIAENWSNIYPPHSSPDNPPAIITGNLARSVETIKVNDEHYQVVAGGDSADYAVHLEYGAPANNLAARPFMLPAAEQTAQEANNAVDFARIINKHL